MRSLQGRLTFGMLSGLIAVFAVQWLVVSLAITLVTENYVESRLQHEVEALLGALTFDDAGHPVLDTATVTPIYRQIFSGHYFRITAGGTELRSRSLWDTDIKVPTEPAGASQRIHRDGPEGQRLLVLAQGFQKQGVNVTIAVAEDLSPVLADIQRFRVGYTVLTVLILGVLVLVQRITVRNALRPLERTRQELARLEQGSVQALDEDVPMEMRPLVHEVNRLLTLTVRRLQRSRNAVGNLAHALKAPLTVLTQVAHDTEAEDNQTLRSAVEYQTDAMRRLVERELRRARLAGEGPAGSQFQAQPEITALVAALRRIHQGRQLDIETRIPADHRFAGDREDMLELLGNLLDNACKWARHRVRITVEPVPGLTAVIEDDGPGIAPDQSEALLRRGNRLDESAEGHGLGLSIVRDIVQQYGGRLELTRSEDLSGLRARVALPPAGQA
jgi:signal transduction histidine kinase